MHYRTGSRNSYKPTSNCVVTDPLAHIERLASDNAVVIFSMSTCCMCHAIKRLFFGMGVNPTVYELDQDLTLGKEIEKALMLQMGVSSDVPLPVVFIGGKLVGAMDTVLASHINGTLVPLLKQAGALWL
ncbi:unnamed protein product [Fraxinus pennsylvanica]|uniref:Glutaredoxin domain-containing protein n=1 Tax=Fraxinus pennsylvanica TaxID=56036 RepID=A0AAD2DIG3_9LAMI|nr:unnamed protein product [Fraxinus pennsylvanica]